MPNISRRTLLKGAAVTGGALAVVSLLPGCTNPANSPSSGPVVVDSKDATSILESFEEAEMTLEMVSEWTLPLGSVLRVGSGVWSAFLVPGETANPMMVGRAVSRDTGEVRELVNDVMSDKGTRGVSLRSDWVLLDIRCSDVAFAWVELNVLTHDWKLYGQSHDNGYPTGEAVVLWESDAEFDPPAMCFAGDKLIWTVIPALSGTKTTEPSFAYLWTAGSRISTSVVESPGRFAAEPAVSGNTVTLAPRVRANEGVFYGITAYSLDDNLATVIDQLVLPSPIRPFRAVRIGDKFAFSVEASYQAGGLFQNMGTFIGTSEGPFTWLSREPSADVSGNGSNLYIIKSRSSYFVVDTEARTYAVLMSAKNSVDYGDFPATLGQTDMFSTFATVKNADTGQPQEVRLRTFAL